VAESNPPLPLYAGAAAREYGASFAENPFVFQSLNQSAHRFLRLTKLTLLGPKLAD